MTIDRAFSINQMSENYFRSVLPSTWLKREQRPDFHVDFIIELDRESEPSGVKCAVQLKGTAKPRVVKESIKYRMRTKHLAYYVDRSPEPVFLVVVDISQRQGYWVHLQEWAKGRDDWRRKKAVTVSVPVANRIEDDEAFGRAIRGAAASMRSVPAAAELLRRKYEGVDPRFAVEVSFEKGTTHVTLNPRERINGRIRIQGPQSKEKLHELMERGLPTTFKPGELSVEGSRLFAELFEENGGESITVHAAKHRPCSASLLVVDGDGTEHLVLQNVASTLEAGIKEVRLEVPVPRTPLTLRCTTRIEDGNKLTVGNVAFTFDYQAWLGQGLVLAAQFDRIARLVRAVAEARPLALHVDVDGNVLFKATINVTKPGYLDAVNGIVELLAQARAVSRYLEIAPKTPDIDELVRQQDHLVLLWRIIELGPVQQAVKDGHGTLECTVQTLRLLVDAGKASGTDDPIAEFVEPLSPVLGCSVDGWYLRRRITRVVLTPEAERSVREHAGADSDVLRVKARVSPESMCTTSLAREE